MPPVEPYAVSRVEQTVRLDSRGQAVTIYRVHFTVGDNGPFYEDFTAAEYIPEAVRTRLGVLAANTLAILPR